MNESTQQWIALGVVAVTVAVFVVALVRKHFLKPEDNGGRGCGGGEGCGCVKPGLKK